MKNVIITMADHVFFSVVVVNKISSQFTYALLIRSKSSSLHPLFFMSEIGKTNKKRTTIRLMKTQNRENYITHFLLSISR